MGDVVQRQEPQAVAENRAPGPDLMLQIALERGASMEQLEKLMDLKERYDANEARKAFAAAMADFRAEAPQIEKNSRVHYVHNGKTTDYRHASLDNICSKVNPVLGKNKLTFSWETEQRDGLITVHCDVTHVMGHKQRTTLFAKADDSGGKNSVQAIGSTVSYLQRYTLVSALGLATGEMEDDGRGNGSPVSDALFITPEQAKEIKDLLRETNADVKKFLEAKGQGASCVDEMPKDAYNGAIIALNRKLREKKEAPNAASR